MTDCSIVGYNSDVIVMLMVNEGGGGNSQHVTAKGQWRGNFISYQSHSLVLLNWTYIIFSNAFGQFDVQ